MPDETRQPAYAKLNPAAQFSWRLLLVLAALAVLAVLLVWLSIILIPLVIAAGVAAVVAPAVSWLVGRGLPRGLAIAAVVIGSLVVVFVAIAFVLNSLISQVDEIAAALSSALDDISVWLEDGPVDLPAQDAQGATDAASTTTSTFWDFAREGIGSGIGKAAQFVGMGALSIIFTIYLLVDGKRMWAWVLGWLRPDTRTLVDKIGRESIGTLADYIRGTAVVAAIDGVAIGLGFWIADIPLALEIGVLTFFLAFIPIVGAWVSGAIGVLVALGDGGAGLAAIAIVIVAAVQELEGRLLGPKIQGEAVNLHPLIILAAVAVGSAYGGIAGALLAVPIVALVYKSILIVREHYGMPAPEP